MTSNIKLVYEGCKLNAAMDNLQTQIIGLLSKRDKIVLLYSVQHDNKFWGNNMSGDMIFIIEKGEHGCVEVTYTYARTFGICSINEQNEVLWGSIFYHRHREKYPNERVSIESMIPLIETAYTFHVMWNIDNIGENIFIIMSSGCLPGEKHNGYPRISNSVLRYTMFDISCLL